MNSEYIGVNKKLNAIIVWTIRDSGLQRNSKYYSLRLKKSLKIMSVM